MVGIELNLDFYFISSKTTEKVQIGKFQFFNILPQHPFRSISFFKKNGLKISTIEFKVGYFFLTREKKRYYKFTTLNKRKSDIKKIYENYKLKRTKLPELLGQTALNLCEQGNFEKMMNYKSDKIIDEKDITIESNDFEFSIDFPRSIAVSSCGHKVWSFHLTPKDKKKTAVILYNFEKNSTNVYECKHQKHGICILVAEDLDLLISGGDNKKLIIHNLKTRKTIKIIDLKNNISFFKRLGRLVAIGISNKIVFLDLVSYEILKQQKEQFACTKIMCIETAPVKEENSDKKKLAIFVAGRKSNEIKKICLLEEYFQRSLVNQNIDKEFEIARLKRIIKEKEHTNTILRQEQKRLLKKLKTKRDKIRKKNQKFKQIYEFSKAIVKNLEIIKKSLKNGVFKEIKLDFLKTFTINNEKINHNFSKINA